MDYFLFLDLTFVIELLVIEWSNNITQQACSERCCFTSILVVNCAKNQFTLCTRFVKLGDNNTW